MLLLYAELKLNARLCLVSGNIFIPFLGQKPGFWRGQAEMLLRRVSLFWMPSRLRRSDSVTVHQEEMVNACNMGQRRSLWFDGS